MQEFLINHYLWLKALHLVAVISWMAGLLYLPRLYVYHSKQTVGSDQDKLFQTMEYKLLKIIMNPAMILSWVFGVALIISREPFESGEYWFYIKLLAVFVMTFFHMRLGAWRRAFVNGSNQKSEDFFRKANEIPTIMMIIIVFMVVLRPF